MSKKYRFQEQKELLSLDEYVRLTHAYLVARPGGLFVAPEAIAGYREGDCVDFELLKHLGFEHPKDPEYYVRENADPDFTRIFEGIKQSQKIDDPIVVYPHTKKVGGIEHKFLIPLDGATRLSVIGYLREEDPNLFANIPIHVNAAMTYDDALAVMVRMNMEGRTRSLTDFEMMNIIYRFVSVYGWSKMDVSEKFGLSKACVEDYMACKTKLISPLQALMQTRQLSRAAAFQAVHLDEDEQRKMLAEFRGEKKPKITADVALQRRLDRRVSNPLGLLNRFGKTMADIRYFNQTMYTKTGDVEFREEISGCLAEIESLVNEARAAIEKKLGIAADTKSKKKEPVAS